MEHSLPAGIVLTMVAGLMSGNCMLPLKFMRSWKWENAWLVFSIISLIVLPWAFAIGFVDHLFEIYRSLSLQQLIVPAVLGAGWGIAQILFGISVQRLGLGISYAIIIGLGAALGTLVPLFLQQQMAMKKHAVIFIVAGVAVMVMGIILTAWGGQIRERSKAVTAQDKPQQNYAAAVLLAVLCGFMAPMLNYAFAFGQDIAREAIHLGNSAVHAGYAVWPIGLAGGFLPNIAYSLYLLARNRTWSSFRSAKPDLFWSSLMGVLWMGAFALYGMSAAYLGSLGTSIGWGFMQIFMILTATLSGVLTGEWRGAPRAARLILSFGLLSLTAAVVLLTQAN